MADPTIAVDYATLKNARIRTLEEGTSVNAFLRGDSKGYASKGRR